MKKNFIIICLVVIMILTGCGKSNQEDVPEKIENQEQSQSESTTSNKTEINEKKQAQIEARKQNENNSVVCMMSEESSGIEMNQEITVNFKSDKIDSAEFVMTAILPDEYKGYKSLFISTLESEFESYEDEYGVKVNVSETDDGVKVDFKMDKSSFDEIYGSSDESSSREEVIAELEEEGYTCK